MTSTQMLELICDHLGDAEVLRDPTELYFNGSFFQMLHCQGNFTLFHVYESVCGKTKKVVVFKAKALTCKKNTLARKFANRIRSVTSCSR